MAATVQTTTVGTADGLELCVEVAGSGGSETVLVVHDELGGKQKDDLGKPCGTTRRPITPLAPATKIRIDQNVG
jgi:hypothetical protein